MDEKLKKLDALYKQYNGCPKRSESAKKIKYEIDKIMYSLSEKDRKKFYKYKYNQTQKQTTTSKKKKKDCRPAWQKFCPKPYELKAKFGTTVEKNFFKQENSGNETTSAGVFVLETEIAANEECRCQHPGCKSVATINGYCEFHNRYQNSESK